MLRAYYENDEIVKIEYDSKKIVLTLTVSLLFSAFILFIGALYGIDAIKDGISNGIVSAILAAVLALIGVVHIVLAVASFFRCRVFSLYFYNDRLVLCEKKEKIKLMYGELKSVKKTACVGPALLSLYPNPLKKYVAICVSSGEQKDFKKIQKKILKGTTWHGVYEGDTVYVLFDENCNSVFDRIEEKISAGS